MTFAATLLLFGGVPLNLTKIMLTYAVPYCVATYGAVSYQLAAKGARNRRWGLMATR
jgi:hypothetical protein